MIAQVNQALAILAASSMASLSVAQSVATLMFEASTDGGSTWSGGAVEVEAVPATLKIRARADWTPAAGYALFSIQFDAMVRDAAAADSVSSLLRPMPFDQFPQTIVASRFGNVIKIDDVRDTLGPDLGTRSIWAIQAREIDNPDNFNDSRPVTIFSFDLHLDGSIGTRVADGAILRDPDGFSRRALVFTDPGGGSNALSASTLPVEIRVVPSLPTLGPMTLLLLMRPSRSSPRPRAMPAALLHAGNSLIFSGRRAPHPALCGGAA